MSSSAAARTSRVSLPLANHSSVQGVGRQRSVPLVPHERRVKATPAKSVVREARTLRTSLSAGNRPTVRTARASRAAGKGTTVSVGIVQAQRRLPSSRSSKASIRHDSPAKLVMA